MSDPLSTSRTAREALARGLNALQADPTVPPKLVDLAAPIAQAMGALHQLEKTNQLAPHADVALNHMRGALASLQAAGNGHPAVLAATDAVAQSLSLVHSLSRMANGPAPTPAAPPPPQQKPQAAPQQQQQQPPPPQQQQQQQQPRAATQHMPQKSPSLQQQMPPQAFPPPQQRPPQQQNAAPPPQGGFNNPGMVSRDPFAPPGPNMGPPAGPPPPGMMPMGPPMGGPQMAAGGGPPMGPGGKPASPSMPVPAPPRVGNMPLIPADLGAHSATNFYKGLAGNDIIDHGGLFVSTYVPPKIGTQVRLKVSLPGGYEFEANAIVKWSREEGEDATPGFGAQFTGITAEARQLVYRYVRNREPLFYDDF